MIHVHGGGWQRGDKNNRWRGGPVVGETLSGQNSSGAAEEADAVVVVISYRLAPVGLVAAMVRSLIFSILLSLIIKAFSWTLGFWSNFSYAPSRNVLSMLASLRFHVESLFQPERFFINAFMSYHHFLLVLTCYQIL